MRMNEDYGNPIETIQNLWQEHLEAGFPGKFRGREVNGIDFIMLDADIAGCVDTFLKQRSLDVWRTALLGVCLHNASYVLPILNDEGTTYYSRLATLAELVLREVVKRTHPEYGILALRVLETERLVLRRMTTQDAPFILQLLNEPSWLQFIGDRNVRTLEEARKYILDGPVAMYARLGFGFYVVALKDDEIPIGICGLVKRDFMEDVDIGYALLPTYWAKGYAYEAAKAVLAYGTGQLGLKRIVAITTSDNHRSARLLEKLGLHFERMMAYPGDEKEVRLFAFDAEQEVPAE